MAERRIYGEVYRTDLKAVFSATRDGQLPADPHDALPHAPSWQEKVGDEASDLCTAAEQEFVDTTRALNWRAEVIGTEPDYDEQWGE